jgi:hypothetical protein
MKVPMKVRRMVSSRLNRNELRIESTGGLQHLPEGGGAVKTEGCEVADEGRVSVGFCAYPGEPRRDEAGSIGIAAAGCWVAHPRRRAVYAACMLTLLQPA